MKGNKYRNKKLTDSAQNEICVSCGNPECCWCHSNASAHGKGRGTKAHDLFGFYGCLNCHNWYDGRSTIAPPNADFYQNKQDWFLAMWDKSMIVACENGYL